MLRSAVLGAERRFYPCAAGKMRRENQYLRLRSLQPRPCRRLATSAPGTGGRGAPPAGGPDWTPLRDPAQHEDRRASRRCRGQDSVGLTGRPLSRFVVSGSHFPSRLRYASTAVIFRGCAPPVRACAGVWFDRLAPQFMTESMMAPPNGCRTNRGMRPLTCQRLRRCPLLIRGRG
jgi:hypothetical protein